jgi:hypothetical protein
MNGTDRVLHPLVQYREEEEEEPATLWLAGEM